MDIEIEVGYFIGNKTELGETITMSNVDNYLFGMVLCNDWSARDIQAWE